MLTGLFTVGELPTGKQNKFARNRKSSFKTSQLKKANKFWGKECSYQDQLDCIKVLFLAANDKYMI